MNNINKMINIIDNIFISDCIDAKNEKLLKDNNIKLIYSATSATLGNNGVDKKSMDLAALEYSRYAENIYLAVLWPAMKSSQSAMLKKIPDIIYSKDVNQHFINLQKKITENIENIDNIHLGSSIFLNNFDKGINWFRGNRVPTCPRNSDGACSFIGKQYCDFAIT